METIEYEPAQARQANRIKRPSLWRALWSNSDDGVDGDQLWRERTDGWSTWRRRLAWWWRNPCHDMLWYWLGTVGLPVFFTARYPFGVHPRDAEGRERGWNVGWIREHLDSGARGWPRPFLSYAGPVSAIWVPVGAFVLLGLQHLVGQLLGLPAWLTALPMLLTFAVATVLLVLGDVLVYVGWRLPEGAVGAKLRRRSEG